MRVVATIVASLAWSASTALAQDVVPAPPDRLPPMEFTTIAYRWVLLVPEWAFERTTYESRGHVPTFESRRFEYPSLEFTTEHRKVGRVPQFSCKYVDFWLPNTCTTTWQDVYIDVPVAVVRRDYLDVDVLEFPERTVRSTIEVPRLVWVERSLVFSIPAVAVPQPST